MTEQELYKIASEKSVLTDSELTDVLTEKDILSIAESAWNKYIKLRESEDMKIGTGYMDLEEARQLLHAKINKLEEMRQQNLQSPLIIK